ncbi:DUF1573 domain-containing protein [Thermodesulfobacteriota bacterium]
MFSLKRYLSFAILVVLFSFSLAKAEPKLYIKDAEHDFGEVEQHKSMKHIFILENKGDEDLEIKEVKPGCGCTAALLSSKIIKPGEKGEVEVTFNSGKFKGNVKKTVSITTNEKPITRSQPASGFGPRIQKLVTEPSRVHTVYINATINYDKVKDDALKRAREAAMKRSKEEKGGAPKGAKKPVVKSGETPFLIDVHPKKIILGEIKLNKDYKRTLKLLNLIPNDKKEFKIDKVSVSAPFASVMLKQKNIQPNKPGEVYVTVNVQDPGKNGGNVLIYVKGYAAPLEVPVTWEAVK